MLCFFHAFIQKIFMDFPLDSSSDSCYDDIRTQIRRNMTKERIMNGQTRTPEQLRKHRKRRQWIKALTNPHLLISVAAAWFLTNGWAYCAFGLGWLLHMPVLRNIGAVYLGLLWMPGTPEKLFTFGIAMVMLRVLFPKDTRTLAMIRRKRRLVWYVTKLQFANLRRKLSDKKRAE